MLHANGEKTDFHTSSIIQTEKRLTLLDMAENGYPTRYMNHLINIPCMFWLIATEQ